MRNDKTFQVQGTVYAKAPRQEGAALASTSFSTPRSMHPTPQSPRVFPVLSYLPVRVAPPVPGAQFQWHLLREVLSNSPDTWPLTAPCSHDTAYTSSLWCLSRLTIPPHLASPLNCKLFESKDQAWFGSVRFGFHL